MAKTVEELEALLNEANSKIDGLVDSKKTILNEKKQLEKQYKDIDKDEYYALRDNFDKLETEHNKLVKANSVLVKDLEQSNNLIAEKDSNLSKLLIDDEITKLTNSFDKHTIPDNKKAAAQRDIKSFGATLVDGVAMVGEETLKEFVNGTWLNDSTMGGAFAQENPNMGGGANGGSGGGGGNAKEMSRVDFQGKSPQAQSEFMSSGGTLTD